MAKAVPSTLALPSPSCCCSSGKPTISLKVESISIRFCMRSYASFCLANKRSLLSKASLCNRMKTARQPFSEAESPSKPSSAMDSCTRASSTPRFLSVCCSFATLVAISDRVRSALCLASCSSASVSRNCCTSACIISIGVPPTRLLGAFFGSRTPPPGLPTRKPMPSSVSSGSFQLSDTRPEWSGRYSSPPTKPPPSSCVPTTGISFNSSL
mmetsp:Transcript_31984/g.74938  ORF Transcript_31984/g.74938 Transcript_31984/m.74938 type:complete len:212 (-) Transcript_31984:2075-2710(-)